MNIKQIKIFDNFTYVLFSKANKAAIVDPGYDASEALDFLSSQKLELIYIINTHYHTDHSKDTKRIKELFPSAKVVASEVDGEKLGIVDIPVSDGSILKLGEVNLRFLLTPGHTPGSICIIVNNKALLTGDTLFIGDCGRTDLEGGNLEDMFASLHRKIKTLPDHLYVYPGHDYGDKPFDTLGNQKRTNKTLLAKDLKEFSEI
jgi:glyoxylase-like metal-dependent hydrolase (beta-lactamase superfamily II)